MYLVSSIVVLLVGPLLYLSAQRRRYLLDVIDGFVFVSVGGLILMHLLHSLEGANTLLVLFLGLAGFLGPNILERTFHKAEHSIHNTVLIFGILGFVLHATIDGAALFSGGKELSLAVILHRLPVGLTAWWLLRPKYSSSVCWLVLSAMCIATAGGYLLGETLLNPSVNAPLEYVQSFVAGSILHVVFFRLHFDDTSHETPHCCAHKHETVGIGSSPKPAPLVKSWPESIGNLLGILLLVLFLVSFPEHGSHTEVAHMATAHHGEAQSFTQLFLSLALQTSPALLIAYLSAILLYGFLPQASIRWMGRGSNFSQSIPRNGCGASTSDVQLWSATILSNNSAKGATPASAIAFLIATPELGTDALLISLPLLGPEFTAVRLIAAASLAVIVSLIVTFRLGDTPAVPNIDEPQETPREKLIKGTRYALIDLVDSTGPWILAGLLLAALAQPLIAEIPLTLPFHLEILLFALVGVVVYVCASGATPLVAVLLAGGVSPGAGLAFLLTGPATNISTFGVLSELHGKKFALTFAISTALCAIFIGYFVNFFLGNIELTSSEALMSHHGNSWELISLFIVVALVVFSLIRKGGRGFLGEIFGREIAA